MKKLKKIALTGANGIIGKVLYEGLKKEYEIIPLDISKGDVLDIVEVDITDYEKFSEKVKGCDVIIHLAWNTRTENCRNNNIDLDNIKMTLNVYKAAIQEKIPRVLMASSVHADSLIDKNIPIPDSPYGANKIFMEALGRYYSIYKQELEVVCIRFGGVNRENKCPKDKGEYEKQVWFSHEDCIELIKKCIEPNKFEVINGISNNKDRIHDFSNQIGWEPLPPVENDTPRV